MDKRNAGKRRRPPEATPAYLDRAAFGYLQRYASSARNLERVLLRKVRRSAEVHGTDPEEGRRHVEATVQKCLRLGLLNDELYAEAKARSLHRRGAPERLVRGKLMQAGIDDGKIGRALERLNEEIGQPELAAAVTFARRRRLGPFRSQQDRAAARDRDLAALGRRGFDLDLARRVIDADDPESLDALLREDT